MTTQERNIIASRAGYADAMAANPPSSCCGYCLVHIDGNHSRYLHANCAAVLRRWVHPTTTEYRLYVPSRTIKRERDLLRKYDAEQRERIEEVDADVDPGDDDMNLNSSMPAPGSAPVAGLGSPGRKGDRK